MNVKSLKREFYMRTWVVKWQSKHKKVKHRESYKKIHIRIKEIEWRWQARQYAQNIKRNGKREEKKNNRTRKEEKYVKIN